MPEPLTVALVVATVVTIVVIEVHLSISRRNAERRQTYLWTQTLDRIRENISSPERMASIDEVRKRLGAQQAYLDMICRSTAAALKSPRSVITLIDAESQTFIAHHAVDEAEGDLHDGAVPLQSSYCQFTVASDKTLVINNAKRDVLVKDNPCTTVLGMRAYLGTPVYSIEGFPVGSLCVFDFTPRRWSDRDVAVIEALAALVSL